MRECSMKLEDQPWWSKLTDVQQRQLKNMGNENISIYIRGRNKKLTHPQAMAEVFGPPVDDEVA